MMMRKWITLLEDLSQYPARVTNAELVAMDREGDSESYHANDSTVYYDGRGATLQELPIDSLEPGNDVDSDIVDIYAGRTTAAPPIIVDGNVVENGNHRLAAAKARGETTILAYVLDK